MQVLGIDAAAGVDALREHPLIRADLVGVGGLSQGGWVSPIAASLSDHVAFVVGLSAPGVSPGEQNLFNQHNRVVRASSEADADEASRILREIYGYLRTGERRDEVLAELEAARELPWFPAANELQAWLRMGLPAAPWRWISALDFDPGTVWRDIDRPVICVWGSDDVCVPPRESPERIGPWLDAAGNRVRELRNLTGAHHDLRLQPQAPWTQGAFPRGMNAIPRFVLSLAAPPPAPPETRRSDELDQHHGEEVEDPYGWFEADDEAARSWARAQDQHTRQSLADDPLVDRLKARMIELNRYARAPIPATAGGHTFIEGEYPGEFMTDLRVRDEGSPDWRLLVDPKAHPASPDAALALGRPLPSPDGRFLLHGASSAALPGCLRLVEVATGTDLPEEAIPIDYWPWLVSWLADSSGYLWVDGAEVRLHRLGTSRREDRLMYRADTRPTPYVAVRGDTRRPTCS